jgi:hypothetical protein
MAAKKSWNADKTLSISAIVVSLCALVVSIIQTNMMQKQQEKSVWPHVRWHTQMGYQPDSTGNFAIHVVNKGVGPALIKKVTYVLDGQKYPADSLGTVVEKMIKDSLRGVSETQFEQTVLLPNDNVIALELTNKTQAFLTTLIYLDKYLDKNRFDIIIEYEDVYGNRFVSTGKTKF